MKISDFTREISSEKSPVAEIKNPDQENEDEENFISDKELSAIESFLLPQVLEILQRN